MSIAEKVQQRSNGQCELCLAKENLALYQVTPDQGRAEDNHAMLCQTCLTQYTGEETTISAHWACLNDSMWSQVPAVQVLAWRMLKKLSAEAWAQDLLDMLYLDEETQAWAEAEIPQNDLEPTLDNNGTRLKAGDTVTLVKDLPVKGAGFTAKRGTVVRGISLCENPLHIEGKVNGVRVVLIADYLKKA
ncbi:PhnA domain-containing protein [Catenovulum sediminis]|uniref:PhnA domain-containing protein n=1 Tax=Catenovulum sediminis TaxID=1740262 RepID=A0ABV1RHT3_9ALTE|nr:alkylphosphonate utilization protein [Catenovulum sediminis]